jgi:hypothetical protein
MPSDTIHDELHEPIVEKEPIARLHHARQRLEGHRDPPRIADNIFIRQRKLVARHKLNRLRLDLPQTHLRPRQIRHDRHAPSGRALRLPDPLHHFRVPGKFAVRKIQPRNIEPRADEPHQHLR